MEVDLEVLREVIKAGTAMQRLLDSEEPWVETGTGEGTGWLIAIEKLPLDKLKKGSIIEL